ncbi:MAG TPA: reverse transcriptase/maturase family protein [Flavilitoribacter sp.]|nr:reverse transcriptase/maturase family protein [Flavilitoribacter sp.]HMQ86730.1 reverse transcriptase/maturase family protein [Flavilitoribacter sp.]
MRRINGLFDGFTSFQNLLVAYKKAHKGTRRTEESSAFFFNLEKELLQIQKELLKLTYQPRAYRYFKIHDPKERIISVAPFRDRVVHHALVNVLEPIYERCFIHDSYATRKGKGAHMAVATAQRYLGKDRWFFKTDVDKYFDSIRHDVLMGLIERKIKDARLLDITARIIGNGGENGTGLPIGNLTSQFFANVYLNGFDHFVKEELKVRRYVRYMDDFVLFSTEKTDLKCLRNQVENYLRDRLALRLKENATFINSAANGLTFLGRRIFPDTIRIARPNLRRMTRRMENTEVRFKEGLISEERFLQGMNSYWAALQYGGNLKLRRGLGF